MTISVETSESRPLTNVRHEIDPALVKAQVDKKIEHYEKERIRLKVQAQESLALYETAVLKGTAHRWTKVPDGGMYIDPMMDEWVETEREYYALVRVIELPVKGNRFVLVYGDADDAVVTTGTGPFKSFDDAAGWFLRSGR